MKKIKIIKSRPLKEEEEVIDQMPQDTAPETPELTFESNPLEFILQKYPSLTDTLIELLTEDFREYINGVYVMAPKPTVFKIVLHNNRSFYLTYLGKTYQAKVSGKKYYLARISELEMATIAIADLLTMGAPPQAQGPETELSSSTEATPEEGGEEETIKPEEGGGEEELTEGKKRFKLNENMREVAKKGETFETLLASKNIKESTKKAVLAALSPADKKLIMSNLSNNINKVVSFLNSNSKLISKTFDIKEGDMGRGEVTLIVCSSDGMKVSTKGEMGDVEVGGKAYELKEAGDKAPIRAGGTYRSSVVSLTTALWLLKDDIFDSPEKEQWKKVLGDNLFSRWQEFGKEIKGDKDNKLVNWTSLGRKQLPKLKEFLTDLRQKFIEISSAEDAKPEFVVGDKALDIDPEDMAKIKKTKLNQKVSLSGKVIPASADYEDIQRFRGIIKILLKKNLFNLSGDQLDDEIKRSFIEEISGGLIMVSPTEFKFINADRFIKEFDFIGITQGNRPQFLPKAK